MIGLLDKELQALLILQINNLTIDLQSNGDFFVNLTT